MSSAHSKRVFFFLSAGWGPVVRALPVINRLADHGVASSLAVGGGAGSQIRSAGFDLVELDLPALRAPAQMARTWWSPYHFLAHCDLKTLLGQVDAYRTAITRGGPALVVTDINPLAALAARSLRVPHVTISQSLFLPFRKRNCARWALPPALASINAVLDHYGAEPVESAEHLDAGDITLVPSIPEFDPMADAPSSLNYLGPILGNALVPLLGADRSASPSAVPEIFFYPGRPHDTTGAAGQALLDVGLAALSAIDATVTVATGGHAFAIPRYEGRHLEVVAWRVISDGYRPDLIVHHGGHGACLTAMSAGIPSVVVPTHAEREYNARNLVALGCGAFVAMDQIDTDNVRRAIASVIESPAHARACAQWSETIAARKYGGAELAAHTMMRMMDG